MNPLIERARNRIFYDQNGCSKQTENFPSEELLNERVLHYLVEVVDSVDYPHLNAYFAGVLLYQQQCLRVFKYSCRNSNRRSFGVEKELLMLEIKTHLAHDTELGWKIGS